MSRYVTPPGVDEREIPYPEYLTDEEIEDFKKKGIKFINWNGWALPIGPGCTTYFYDEISHRLKHNKSVVERRGAVHGSTGNGQNIHGYTACTDLRSEIRSRQASLLLPA